MRFAREETPPFIDLPAPRVMISGFHLIHMIAPGIQQYVCYENHLGPDGQLVRQHSGDLLVAACDTPYLIQQATASLVTHGLRLLVRPPALVQ